MLRIFPNGGGEQAEIGKSRMLCGAGKRINAVINIGKGQDRQLCHSQRDIQIAQANVGIDAQHALPKLCQSARHTGAKRCFPGTAFAGADRHYLSHTETSHLTVREVEYL